MIKLHFLWQYYKKSLRDYLGFYINSEQYRKNKLRRIYDTLKCLNKHLLN